MRSKLVYILSIICFCESFNSCTKSIYNNTNSIFDNYEPSSKEYKEELIKQLSIIDKSKLTYWFKEYIENEKEEQLLFYVKSDELCAILVLNVEQWNKLEHLRKVKGVSYRGCQFLNLQFEIEYDSLHTKFIYKDFTRIID